MNRRGALVALGTLGRSMLGGSLLGGCGYRPLRSGLSGSPRLRVASSTARVASLQALGEELATGARAELARHEALSGSGLPLHLEVIRLEEVGEGDGVVADLPSARGVRVGVVARGRLEGGDYETADLEASEVLATGSSPTSFEVARSAAARSAARRAGALVARAVLGLP